MLQLFWNPKFFYRIRRCLPPVPILSQLDPAHTLISLFLKIHLNIIFLSMPGSPKWYFFLLGCHLYSYCWAVCSGIIEQNINIIRGALLDGNRIRNVRKIFLLRKMKKFVLWQDSAESCVFYCKTSCTFLFVGIMIAFRSGVVRHKWDYAIGTTVLTHGWDFAVCKIYVEVESCLHHHRLTPGHGIDSATGDKKMKRTIFWQKMATTNKETACRKLISKTKALELENLGKFVYKTI